MRQGFYEHDSMQQSFKEASDRLRVTIDDVYSLIFQGKLVICEGPPPQELMWLSEECVGKEIVLHQGSQTFTAEEQHGPSSQESVLLEMLEVNNQRIQELTWQLEARDQQLEINDRQLAGRAQEIQRLHEILYRTQKMAFSSRQGPQSSWWKRWVPGLDVGN